jgi:hypothetical protein
MVRKSAVLKLLENSAGEGLNKIVYEFSYVSQFLATELLGNSSDDSFSLENPSNILKNCANIPFLDI